MTESLYIPRDYKPLLDPQETEKAILLIKNFFQTNLAFELNLTRVTAPIVVKSDTGINDDLNGIERPIRFTVKAMADTQAEIVQSLAKWKRMALADLGLPHGEGIYTDMNAIRPDDKLDNIHSIYVDQWDWERVISAEERSLAFLRHIVEQIYNVVRRTEKYVCHHYGIIRPVLPEKITFIHSEDLEKQYPHLKPSEREKAACKKHHAVFVIGIGADLRNGEPHDGRAPDYDDWWTPTEEGYRGLNGDILVHNPVLDDAFEISSMGIRVDAAALERQLELKGVTERKELLFHRRLLKGELPLSVGGGIGQSRLCMLYLRKAHIGEIQSSIWSDAVKKTCHENNIVLL
jgi:aspartate--ammonia ligase